MFPTAQAKKKMNKIHPFLFKYKMIELNVYEKDDNVSVEVLSGNYPLSVSYNPLHPKGHFATVKVEYSNSDKQTVCSRPLSLIWNIQVNTNWFAAISESDSGLSIEIMANNNPLMIEHQNSLVSNNVNVSSKDNKVNIRFLQPAIDA